MSERNEKVRYERELTEADLKAVCGGNTDTGSSGSVPTADKDDEKKGDVASLG